MTNIRLYNDTSELCRNVAKCIEILIADGSYTASLSGGTTPKALYEHIAKSQMNLNWDRVKLFWGDERMVPFSSSESNYGEFFRILVKTGVVPKSSLFPMNYWMDEEKMLEEINVKMRQNVFYANGLPRFDFVILGVGEDGHIASIFNDNLKSFESRNAVEIVTQPITGERRITLTGSVINNAKEVVFLCTGASKSDILYDIINNNNKEIAATHVNPIGDIHWFVDQEAVSKL